MPIKRDASIDSDSIRDKSTTPSPSKKARGKGEGRTAWSTTEELKFLAAIDEVVKGALWSKIKDDAELSKRGANGIRAHWDALYKKLKNTHQ